MFSAAENCILQCWDTRLFLDGIVGQNLQVAIMGTGSAWMATALQGMGNTFKGKGAGLPVFDEQIAHLLLAAADYVLVPSRFEPCGLVAQSGCRYGAVPIVTSVGGLKDLVTEDVRSHSACSFLYGKMDAFDEDPSPVSQKNDGCTCYSKNSSAAILVVWLLVVQLFP